MSAAAPFALPLPTTPAATAALPSVLPGTFGTKAPIGEMKKIVSLVDRSAFDEFVYPRSEMSTRFQPDFKPYHNFTHESVVWSFSGSPAWGQRITFSVPWPWQGDFLNYIALRLKPSHWLPPAAAAHIGPDRADWVPLVPNDFWVWANSLGTAAIERAEMEVDGVIIESFSGDWLNVWNKTCHTVGKGAAFDDALYASYKDPPPVSRFRVSDDGYLYCYLPFWFTKHANAAFPLLSCSGPDTVRFHITLRPFKDVVRRIGTAAGCGADESPLGSSFVVRDYTFPFYKTETVRCNDVIPGFEAADILCGISNIDGGLREEYIHMPHEILAEPVVETDFAEPLKYVVNTGAADTVKVQLPLTVANGPIRQLLFFLRRKASVSEWRDWNNYSATLRGESDPVWNPTQPLLVRAALQVGTATWADEEEKWWRASGDVLLPGGIRAFGNYIYAYNFAEKPAEFSPSGSLNASRVDLRLNLTVAPPGGATDGEWSVHVFLVGTNWLRFEKGLANWVFMD
jgi:hypothetical protein